MSLQRAELTRTIGITLAVFGMSVAAASSAHAQKIASFDMQRALRSVAEGKKAQESLQKDMEARQKKLAAEKKKIDDAVADFQKQAALFNDKTRREKEEAINAQIMKLRELDAKNQQEFQEKDREVSEPIIKKMRDTVSKVSKEKGYTMVIDGSANVVIFTTGEDDLTEEVIKAYDGKKK